MWDHIMGTNYDPDKVSKGLDKRNKEAKDQAALVKCKIGNGLKDSSIKD